MHFSKTKIALILLVLVVGLGLAVPNLIPASQRSSIPSWLPSQGVTLGLDLQGGAYLFSGGPASRDAPGWAGGGLLLPVGQECVRGGAE